MSEAPDRDARPQQATVGAGIVIAAGVLHVFGSFDQMRDLRSIETKERLETTLSTPSGRGLGINQDQLLDWMHVGLLISAAAATAAIVMGVQALRRESSAPKILIGLSALTVIGAVLLDPLMGMFLAAGTAMLWSGPARDWFAHRPVRASRLELAMSQTPQDPQPPRQADTPEHTTQQPPSPNQQPPAQPYPPQQPYPQQPGQQPYPYGAPQPVQQQVQQPGLPYGAPAYGMGAPQQWQPQRGSGAPTQVKVASLIALIATGLVAALYALLLIGIVAAADQIMTELEANPQLQELNLSGDDLRNIIAGASAFLLVWSVIAIVLAVLTWRRHNWARILLIISSVVTALLGLLALPFSLLHIGAAIAVVVLLLGAPAREWFSRTPQFSAPYPGQPGAPGTMPGYGQHPQQQNGQQDGQRDGDPSQPPRDDDTKPPVW